VTGPDRATVMSMLARLRGALDGLAGVRVEETEDSVVVRVPGLGRDWVITLGVEGRALSSPMAGVPLLEVET